MFDNEIGDLLSLHEVADLLRVPEATLRYSAPLQHRARQLQVGRHVRYRRQDVHAWLRG